MASAPATVAMSGGRWQSISNVGDFTVIFYWSVSFGCWEDIRIAIFGVELH